MSKISLDRAVMISSYDAEDVLAVYDTISAYSPISTADIRQYLGIPQETVKGIIFELKRWELIRRYELTKKHACGWGIV